MHGGPSPELGAPDCTISHPIKSLNEPSFKGPCRPALSCAAPIRFRLTYSSAALALPSACSASRAVTCQLTHALQLGDCRPAAASSWAAKPGSHARPSVHRRGADPGGPCSLPAAVVSAAATQLTQRAPCLALRPRAACSPHRPHPEGALEVRARQQRSAKGARGKPARHACGARARCRRGSTGKPAAQAPAGHAGVPPAPPTHPPTHPSTQAPSPAPAPSPPPRRRPAPAAPSPRPPRPAPAGVAGHTGLFCALARQKQRTGGAVLSFMHATPTHPHTRPGCQPHLSLHRPRGAPQLGLVVLGLARLRADAGAHLRGPASGCSGKQRMHWCARLEPGPPSTRAAPPPPLSCSLHPAGRTISSWRVSAALRLEALRSCVVQGTGGGEESRAKVGAVSEARRSGAARVDSGAALPGVSQPPGSPPRGARPRPCRPPGRRGPCSRPWGRKLRGQAGVVAGQGRGSAGDVLAGSWWGGRAGERLGGGEAPLASLGRDAAARGRPCALRLPSRPQLSAQAERSRAPAADACLQPSPMVLAGQVGLGGGSGVVGGRPDCRCRAVPALMVPAAHAAAQRGHRHDPHCSWNSLQSSHAAPCEHAGGAVGHPPPAPPCHRPGRSITQLVKPPCGCRASGCPASTGWKPWRAYSRSAWLSCGDRGVRQAGGRDCVQGKQGMHWGRPAGPFAPARPARLPAPLSHLRHQQQRPAVGGVPALQQRRQHAAAQAPALRADRVGRCARHPAQQGRHRAGGGTRPRCGATFAMPTPSAPGRLASRRPWTSPQPPPPARRWPAAPTGRRPCPGRGAGWPSRTTAATAGCLRRGVPGQRRAGAVRGVWVRPCQRSAHQLRGIHRGSRPHPPFMR